MRPGLRGCMESPIGHLAFHNIQWGLARIAKFNVKVAIARNFINISLASVDLLNKLPAFLELQSQRFHYYKYIKFTESYTDRLELLKGRLKTAKNIASMLVFTVTSAEILSPGFWDSAATSLAKKSNRLCKFVYSGLDTCLLIPNQWNWIDLAKWCNEIGLKTGFSLITPKSIVFCKDVFVIGSAGFGIWHANEEIDRADQMIQKDMNMLPSDIDML